MSGDQDVEVCMEDQKRKIRSRVSKEAARRPKKCCFAHVQEVSVQNVLTENLRIAWFLISPHISKTFCSFIWQYYFHSSTKWWRIRTVLSGYGKEYFSLTCATLDFSKQDHRKALGEELNELQAPNNKTSFNEHNRFLSEAGYG